MSWHCHQAKWFWLRLFDVVFGVRLRYTYYLWLLCCNFCWWISDKWIWLCFRWRLMRIFSSLVVPFWWNWDKRWHRSCWYHRDVRWVSFSSFCWPGNDRVWFQRLLPFLIVTYHLFLEEFCSFFRICFFSLFLFSIFSLLAPPTLRNFCQRGLTECGGCLG
jgi:hypothetical protein